MTSRLHPGVYVEELPSGSRSIEAAPTSTTIFVGETERGPLAPTRITGKTEYERLYGGNMRSRTGLDPTRVFMPYAVNGFFDNGGGSAYILRTVDDFANADAAVRGPVNAGEFSVVAAYPGIWGDSVRVTYAASTDADTARFRVMVFYASPETQRETLVEDWDRLSVDSTDENYVQDVLSRSSYIRGVLPDPPTAPTVDNNVLPPPDEETLRTAGTLLAGGVGGGLSLNTANLSDQLAALDGIDDAALLVPAGDRLLPGLPDSFTNPDDYVDYGNLHIDYTLARPLQDLFCILDLPRLNTASPVTDARNHADGAGGATPTTASNFNGVYWPHNEVADPVGAGASPTLTIPPAGHVAGLFARTDARRGVWKAPAGVDATLSGVRRLDHRLLDADQDVLNPRGINALRQIPGAGNVIWGARTRQPTSEWRYVPVRRTAIFLRKSIYDGIQWAVFEPNDEDLWASLRATIGGFMETQFRNGAFAGSTSREAYFVKVDAETTTEDDRAAGIVNILVGFAPLRPAEFVVVKISQKVNQQA